MVLDGNVLDGMVLDSMVLDGMVSSQHRRILTQIILRLVEVVLVGNSAGRCPAL